MGASNGSGCFPSECPEAVSLGAGRKVPMYLGLGIDVCLVLKQKLHQPDVSIMTCHMERGVTHLKGKKWVQVTRLHPSEARLNGILIEATVRGRGGSFFPVGKGEGSCETPADAA